MNISLYSLIFLVLLILMSSLILFKKKSVKKEDKYTRYFVFGYGSLINTRSRKRTTGKDTKGFPVLVKNLKRIWNVNVQFKKDDAYHLPIKSRVLGVKIEKGSYCNGVITEVSKEEFDLLDKREKMYFKYLIPDSDIKFYEKSSKVDLKNTRVYGYIPHDTNMGLNYPIHQTYVDICVIGCFEFEEKFTDDFFKFTYDWSKLTNDRRNPVYIGGKSDVGDLLSNSETVERISKAMRKIPEYHKDFTEKYDLI